MSDLQIRLRTSEDSTAQPIGSMPLGADPTSVLNLIGAWGIRTEYGEFDQSALVGQFALDNTGAYFEIIVDVGEI
jgi:hypothetical protein